MRASACFGEMALIDLFLHSASVRMDDDCAAIETSPALLYQVYKQNLKQFTLVQINVAREPSRRLCNADEKFLRAIGGTPMEEELPLLT